MDYTCKDCSYRGAKSGQDGACPACGSYNLVRGSLEPEQTTRPRKWRLVVLALLWTYLLAMIIWKLIPWN